MWSRMQGEEWVRAKAGCCMIEACMQGTATAAAQAADVGYNLELLSGRQQSYDRWQSSMHVSNAHT